MNKSQGDTRDKGRVLKELKAAQERGLIRGFYGRLGDLGSIQQQYDIAISTACSQLEFMVVETVTDAESCINYLKQNNVGRASFIVLEKMRVHEQQRLKPFEAPNNSQRLFDLIQLKDEKFLNAFYFAIKDTLVAADIKIGTEIAFKNP